MNALFWLTLACISGKAPGGGPPGGTSTTTDDTATTDDSGTYGDQYDWDAVTAWGEAYVAAILATGACPTAPPDEIVQLDGTMGPVRLEDFEPVDTFGTVNVESIRIHYTVGGSDGGPGETWDSDDCWDWDHGNLYDLPSGGIAFGASAEAGLADLDGPVPLVSVARGVIFRHDGAGYPWEEGVATAIGELSGPDYSTPGAAHGIVCLDSFAPPPTLNGGEAPYRGAVLLHMEFPSITSDIFWTFDRVDCAYAEDAGTRHDDYGNASYEADCDGLDNDLDGEIDEGAEDRDSDGGSDCLQGIPAR